MCCVIFRNKLESSVEQWKAYDTQHEALSQWLRDTESNLRGEATLKPDLPAKKKQLDVFKVCFASHCAENWQSCVQKSRIVARS